MGNKEKIKALIELSGTVDDVDDVIEKYTPFRTTSEKIAYLYGMFDVEFLCGLSDNAEEDYAVLRDAIINAKWRS